MKNTVRLNFEFPKEYYPYLKMLLAKEEKSLKEFASDLIIREIEQYEDFQLAGKARSRLSQMDDKEWVDFNEATRLAGWDDAEEV